ESFESNKEENQEIDGWNTLHYNDTIAFPDMENIRSLISNRIYIRYSRVKLTDVYFNDQKYKWKIDWKNKKLSVCNQKNDVLCSKKLPDILECSILNNNALVSRIGFNNVIIIKYDIDNNKITDH